MEATDYAKDPFFLDTMRSSPHFDQIVEQFASDLITRENLGHGPSVDVLAVSFSANDYIGHRYGNGGAEMCTQQAALDRTVGSLIGAIKAQNVPFMIVLTADHGATDAAEREHEHDPAAERLDAKAFEARMMAHLTGMGLGTVKLKGDEQQILIDTDDVSLKAKVSDALVTWLKQQPQVRDVFTRAQIEAVPMPINANPATLSMIQRYRESYVPARSGDIAVAYAPRTSFGEPAKLNDSVAGHGSPWDHDRQVPILFWWPGAPQVNSTDPAETVDIRHLGRYGRCHAAKDRWPLPRKGCGGKARLPLTEQGMGGKSTRLSPTRHATASLTGMCAPTLALPATSPIGGNHAVCARPYRHLDL